MSIQIPQFFRNNSFFVIDAESIGLYGEVFAIAGGVYLSNGAAQWEFSISCDPDRCEGADEDRKWVYENVPVMTETHRTPKALRDEFWKIWLKAKINGSVMAAECLYPVEAGLVAACVRDDPNRKQDAPYPFHEIASYMAAAGMNPMQSYSRTASEDVAHNPLCDARQSARLLSEAIQQLTEDIEAIKYPGEGITQSTFRLIGDGKLEGIKFLHRLIDDDRDTAILLGFSSIREIIRSESALRELPEQHRQMMRDSMNIDN